MILLAAHVVKDAHPPDSHGHVDQIIREVALRPDGSFVDGLQLLHGEVLRIHLEEDDGSRGWEYIRIDPAMGPLMSIMPGDE